jgi:hypothetical protein
MSRPGLPTPWHHRLWHWAIGHRIAVRWANPGWQWHCECGREWLVADMGPTRTGKPCEHWAAKQAQREELAA